MAHVEHFKAPDFARVCNEWARETRADGSYKFRRTGAIDKARTPLNYTLGGSNRPDAMRAALAARLGQVEHSKRRDLNVVSDWVLTCPVELRDDPAKVRRYFEVCREALAERYGAENLLPGSVHMDEGSPHMHQPMIPVKAGRVSSKALFTRAELKQVHRALDKALEAEFGIPGLALNGRTKGNYTVAELRERTQAEADLVDWEARLGKDSRAVRKRERAVERKEAEVRDREKALEARQKALEAREAALAGEYTQRWQTALEGLQRAERAYEDARASVEQYGRKHGWPDGQFGAGAAKQSARLSAGASRARKAAPARPKGAARAEAERLAAEALANGQGFEGRQLGG